MFGHSANLWAPLRKTIRVVLAGVGVAVVAVGVSGAARAMSPAACESSALAPAMGNYSEWHHSEDLLQSIGYRYRVYRYRVFHGVRIRGRRPVSSGAGCCPNSMLVCPLGRHFC